MFACRWKRALGRIWKGQILLLLPVWFLLVNSPAVLAQSVNFSGILSTFDCAPGSGAAGLSLGAANSVLVTNVTTNQVLQCNPGSSSAVALPLPLASPQAVTSDAAGNIYVADSGNNRVLEVKPGGSYQALGSGMNHPAGVAVASDGTVYISDTGNDRILRIAPAPDLTQTSLPVQVHQPQGITVGPAGDLYIADAGDNGIVHIFADGTTEVLGSGLLSPRSVAIDTSGDIYVADTGNARIVGLYPSQGQQITLGGGFVAPVSLTLDTAGDLLIADSSLSSLVKISLHSYAFSPTSVGASSPPAMLFYYSSAGAQLGSVTAQWLGVQGSGFNLTSDTCSNVSLAAGQSCYVTFNFAPVVAGEHLGAISVQNPDGSVVTTPISGSGNAPRFAFTPTAAASLAETPGLFFPTSVAFDPSGSAYVADYGSDRVLKFGSDGSESVLIDGNTPLMMQSPNHVAIDGAGNVFVSDSLWGTVIKIPPSGTPGFLIGIGQMVNGAGVGFPTGMAVDPQGTVYVADQGEGRIIKAAPDGTTAVVIDNTASAAIAGENLTGPLGVAVDASGNVYVADTDNNRIVEVDQSGTASVLIAADTEIGKLSLSAPSDLVVDAVGNLYILDTGNDRVVRRTPSGQLTTYVSNALLEVSPWTYMEGLSLDPSGNLYVADSGDNEILELARQTAGANFTDAAPAMNIVAENIGTENLKLTGVSLISGQSSFTIGSASTCSSGTSLSPGASCEVSLSPLGTGSGTTGTLAFVDDDLNASAATQQATLTAEMQPGAPSAVLITGLDAETIAGQAQTFTLRVTDQFGNTIPSYTGTIVFSSNDQRAVIKPPYTFTAADQGSHVFVGGVTFATAGVETLTAVSSENLVGNATSQVSPGPPVIVSAAQGAVQQTATGQPYASPLTAIVKDQWGNAVPGVLVTFANLGSGSGALLNGSSTTTVATDGTGESAVQATAAAQAGMFEVTATVPGIPEPAVFNLTNASVPPADAQLSISASSASVQLQGAQPASVAISLLSYGTFTGKVLLSCEGLPANTTCNFTPETVSLAPGQHVSSILTVRTGKPAPRLPRPHSDPRPYTAAIPFCALILLLPLRRFRSSKSSGGWIVCLALCVLIPFMSGCGNTTLEVPPTTSQSIRVIASEPSTGTQQQVISLTIER